MLNQVSKKLFRTCFPFKNQLNITNKTFLTKKIRFFFFNSGKYDINKDYYAILGLSKDTDQSTIKKQYYKLAKQYHPDVNPSANDKFKLINEAYEVLSDQKLKAQYDESRVASQAQQKFKQKRNEYQSNEDYRAQFYQQYQRAYQQMGQYEQYLIRKQFTRLMFRIFFFGFAFTLFFIITFGPRRVIVDEFGRPVDVHGRPIDRYGNPIGMQNVAASPPIYDPYGLGGVPRNSYPQQAVYGRQYTSQAPRAAQPGSGEGNQTYY